MQKETIGSIRLPAECKSERNMDLQDLQDNRRSDYPFGEITEKIILYILSIHVHSLCSFCSKTYA